MFSILRQAVKIIHIDVMIIIKCFIIRLILEKLNRQILHFSYYYAFVLM